MFLPVVHWQLLWICAPSTIVIERAATFVGYITTDRVTPPSSACRPCHRSKSLAVNAVGDKPMNREASDAIRRFSSAGSQVVQMLGVSAHIEHQCMECTSGVSLYQGPLKYRPW